MPYPRRIEISKTSGKLTDGSAPKLQSPALTGVGTVPMRFELRPGPHQRDLPPHSAAGIQSPKSWSNTTCRRRSADPSCLAEYLPAPSVYFQLSTVTMRFANLEILH